MPRIADIPPLSWEDREARRDERRKALQRIEAVLGPEADVRTRPRDPISARALRALGTPEHRIGPVDEQR
ncbi:MAG: hypothetical protein M0P31_13335 [Solirubrobacteraceae bacterium]|nr:hypothetical protein [Solirubrobacteraceae bacterium]